MFGNFRNYSADRRHCTKIEEKMILLTNRTKIEPEINYVNYFVDL